MPEYSLTPLGREHSVRGLKFGDAQFAPLKQFLAQDARKYQDVNLARTYVACEVGENTVRAYISIVCGEVNAKLEPNDGVKFPHNYPAIKIARLAVDHRHGGSGLGRYLVDVAIGIAKDTICPAVGCRFAVVDAKPASVKFYEKCGFTFLDTPENRTKQNPLMFLDLLRA